MSLEQCIHETNGREGNHCTIITQNQELVSGGNDYSGIFVTLKTADEPYSFELNQNGENKCFRISQIDRIIFN